MTTEEYPGRLRFQFPFKLNETSKVLLHHLPPNHYIKYENGFQVGSHFGKFVSHEIEHHSWIIGRLNFSVKKPVAIFPYTEEPMVVIYCLLKGNLSLKVFEHDTVHLNKSRYGICYLPALIKGMAELKDTEYELLYLSLSLKFLQNQEIDHPKFKTLCNALIKKETESVLLPDYRVGVKERKILYEIEQGHTESAFPNAIIKSGIITLLVSYFTTLQSSESIFSERDIDQQSRIEDIQKFIENNFHQPLRIEALSVKAGMNLRSFERKFKEIHNITPSEYIERLRVSKAMELLRTTDLPISSISYQVGFSSTNYFSSVFLKVHNCSPSKYRKTHANNTY